MMMRFLTLVVIRCFMFCGKTNSILFLFFLEESSQQNGSAPKTVEEWGVRTLMGELT